MNLLSNVSGTIAASGAVQTEIVALPTYILQHYETPLVGMGVIIGLALACFGVLKLLGHL